MHPDLKNLVCKEGSPLFNDEDYRLPLGLIMTSKLEDYFQSVLLSSRFKDILCDERSQLESLMWAKSHGCHFIKPSTDHQRMVKCEKVLHLIQKYPSLLSISKCDNLINLIHYLGSEMFNRIRRRIQVLRSDDYSEYSLRSFLEEIYELIKCFVKSRQEYNELKLFNDEDIYAMLNILRRDGEIVTEGEFIYLCPPPPNGCDRSDLLISQIVKETS